MRRSQPVFFIAFSLRIARLGEGTFLVPEAAATTFKTAPDLRKVPPFEIIYSEPLDSGLKPLPVDGSCDFCR